MEDLVGNTLRKVKKGDMKPLLLKWGRLDAADIDFDVKKSDCIERLIHLCKKKDIAFEDAAELDLIFCIKNSHKKNWVAYELQLFDDRTVSERKNLKVFKRTLAKNVRKFMHCDLSALSHGRSFWCRISQQQSCSYALFLIYYPCSRYFLVSTQGTHATKLKRFVVTAVAQTLDAKASNVLPLSGKKPDALAQILLHTSKEAQENYYDDGYYLPKRRRLEPNASPVIDGVTVENSRQRDADRKANEDCFGPYVQPTLQNISIQLETKYKAKKVLPNMASDTVITGKIRFSGEDVIEGMRSLVSKNLAVPPLPNYLSKISTIGKNNLVIKEK